MNRLRKNKKSRLPKKKKSSLPTEGILRFDQYAGDLAWKETRSITILTPEVGLPLGNYGFIEHYCADPNCDCRRVILQVWAENSPGEILATIGYGWESEEFYKEWMHGDEETAKEMRGPELESMQPQSALAPKLLAVFKNTAMKDDNYLLRLQAHYALAKKKQGAK